MWSFIVLRKEVRMLLTERLRDATL